MTDQKIILTTAALRAVAVSLSSVLITMHLISLGSGPGEIAFAVALGLFACSIGTFFAAFMSDHFGRKRTILLLSACMTIGGLCLALFSDRWIMYGAIFVGMVNGMGRDRGMGLTVDQVMLPQTTSPQHRTKTFAWYNVVVDFGNAVGALIAFVPAIIRFQTGASALASYQWTWFVYAGLSALGFLLTLGLSRTVELTNFKPRRTLSPESLPFVRKFAFLSGLDSFGGGFLSTALVSYWFVTKFGVNEEFLAPLFFCARVANGFSHLGAAWIASRIGLVKTMVFTHMPSSFLLMTVPFAPTLTIAVVLFLIRESLVEMDVPTRQSYIVAIVKEDERSLAAGITNLTRGVAWATAPVLAGPLMSAFAVWTPLVVGPVIKVAYDILLFKSFNHIKPPEERA